MKRNQPFARAIAMFNLIQAAMSGPGAQAALAKIGPYVSHGKGRGKQFDKQRHGNVCHNTPHQGKKECARRVAQMERNAQ